MHEMAHAVGLDHQHQRPDRKQFITIHTENIKEEILDQFDIINDGSLEVVGIYDYDSLMHYSVGSPSQFDVLRLDEQPGAIVGQRDHLSVGDVKATLYLYGFSVTRTVDFGLTAVGDVKVRQVSVANHLARLLSIRGGTVSPAFFAAGGFPVAVAPFGTASGTVEFVPTTAGS